MKKYLVVLIGIGILVFIFCNILGKGLDISLSKEDTITNSFNGATNTERLVKFIENVGNKKKDKINIIRFTTEGDPITTQFNFNGKDIEISTDLSKDKFGGSDKNKIIHTKISGSTELKDNLLKYLGDNGFYKS